jgi:hypothetical protein
MAAESLTGEQGEQGDIIVTDESRQGEIIAIDDSKKEEIILLECMMLLVNKTE